MALRRKTSDPLGLTDVGAARGDYAMAKRSGAQTRMRRGVPSQGASADYHYHSESDWLWMQELAWEIFRNHLVVGSVVKRAVENQIQDGFNYDPRTGDPQLDKDLKQWWAETSIQPDQCSPDGESVFVDQEETALLTTLVGGDCFGVPADDGTVDFIESQFCRSATRGKNTNVIHGIEMDPVSRRRRNYFFAQEPIGSWSPVLKSQLVPTPAYYFDDLTQREERNVFHVKLLGRFHQTRGITAFAPLFTPADYLDDVEYLEMVHKRAASLFAFVRTRAANFDPKFLAAELQVGVDATAEKARDQVEAANNQFRKVAPGAVLNGLPGETINLSSPNIPNSEHFRHMETLLTYIGINLGMPLVAVLMDGRQTNFSGWRGAWNMAMAGFRRNQRRLITKFHCPYMRFKLLKRAEREPAFKRIVMASLRANAKYDVFSHWWQPPSWPYIQPVEDATADLIRDTSMQTSPRRRCQERGMEWDEIVQETVEDRGSAIRTALTTATAINQEFKLDGPNEVTWRDLAPLPLPERVTVQLRPDQQQAEPQQPQQQPTNGKQQNGN